MSHVNEYELNNKSSFGIMFTYIKYSNVKSIED